MKISKEVKNLNVPWEKEYGYSQAVKVGDTIYLSGQISHDETGEIIGINDVEAQIRQAYVNIKKLLAEYGAGVENIVDETWFVTDMESVDAAGGKLRREIFSGNQAVALTVVQIQRLAFPELLIEIKCIARV
jgi:enamine deaminase RidA (YjgF/YER057c/UK114 family)